MNTERILRKPGATDFPHGLHSTAGTQSRVKQSFERTLCLWMVEEQTRKNLPSLDGFLQVSHCLTTDASIAHFTEQTLGFLILIITMAKRHFQL